VAALFVSPYRRGRTPAASRQGLSGG
jgi:hypothetical protein